MTIIKPLHKVTLPSDLVGVQNGDVPVALRTPCGVPSAYNPFPTLDMHHLASRAMKAMMAHAQREMPNLQVHGTGTGRTLQQQITLFDGTSQSYWSGGNNGRYIPEALWGKYAAMGHAFASPVDVRNWPGHGLWKRRAGTAGAAVPGTSNHGFWLAIDFSEELDGNPLTSEGISAAFTHWLVDNALAYGFAADTQAEDWHWQYYVGDAVPMAVLQFEGQQDAHVPPATIPPTQGEEEMILFTHQDSRYANVFVRTTSGCFTVTDEEFLASPVKDVPHFSGRSHDATLFEYMRETKLKAADMVLLGGQQPAVFPADLA